MDRYIEQLIEDLRLAATQVPKPGEFWDEIDMENPAELEDMAYIRRFLDGHPAKLSEIVRVDKVVFPPPERLSEPQTIVLQAEMTRLLRAFHFEPEFPQKLPGRLKYKVLREYWDSVQTFVDGGTVDLEFCDCEPESCPFPQQFCDCLRAEEEENDHLNYYENNEDDELPI